MTVGEAGRILHAGGSLPAWIARLGGWQTALLAWLAGSLATFGLAPYDFPPVGFISFPVLVWLMDALSQRQGRGLWAAFRLGWCFGFGYFLGGLWWLGAAMLVDADAFLWALPFAVLGLPAVLAVYHGLALVVARLLWNRSAWRILALAAGFATMEFLRGRLFSGFPWNEIGLMAAPAPLFMQTAAIVGLHGLTLGAVTVFAAPALLAQRTAGRWPCLALAVALAMAHVAFGAFRLATTPTVQDETVRIRIIQPNIDQSRKWDPDEATRIFRRLLDMTGERGPETAAGQTFVIWPESSFPFLLTENSPAMQPVGEALAPGEILVAGAARVVDGEGGSEPLYFNSLVVVDDEGRVIATRDKVHLVPFGEYLPFQTFVERLGISQLTQLPGGFSAASGRNAIEVPFFGSFLPLICYEIIFQDEVITSFDGIEKPRFILNVTNDAWFGRTPGPYQHLRQTELTAVSAGMPLVRAANSGISVINDGLGRTIVQQGLAEAGVIEAALPLPPLAPTFTLYKNRIFYLILFVFYVALLHKRDICKEGND